MQKTKDSFFDPSFDHFLPSRYNLFASRLVKHNYYETKYKQIKKSYDSFRFKQINFELLTIFYTVVVLGSISKAAKQLSLSQPAVSISIRKIEKEIGTILFAQANPQKLVILTPQGSIVFNHIQRLFQIIEETLDFSKVKLNNLTYNDSPRLTLLECFNKKRLFYQTWKSPIFTFVSARYLRTFNYLENESKLIILQKRFVNSENLPLSNNKSFMSTKFIVDKSSSFKNLNRQIFFSLNQDNFIEIQSKNALNISFEIKISDLVYWGSNI